MQSAKSPFRGGTRASCAGAGLFVVTATGILSAQSALAWDNFGQPTYSSPIVLSAENKLLWSVNPADNSVSVIRTDTNTLIVNIKVGNEPQSVAVDQDNKFAYVANAAGSDVTVIKIINADPDKFQADVYRLLTTGAEPWNIVSSPDGKRIFVANSSQDTITVIDAKHNRVIGNVDLRNSAMTPTANGTSSREVSQLLRIVPSST
jgi:YVTN family beta-propeller protein